MVQFATSISPTSECAVRDFRQLKVWEKSHDLVLSVYQARQSFPREEIYGLTSQVRRAAASIPSSIAEGCGRNSQADLARFCDIGMGSASELEYQLLLARGLSWLTSKQYENLLTQVTEVKRMLAGYIHYLRSPRPTT
jgi:four helix bundle protein